MQNRADFLTTGLVPVTSEAPVDECCPICCETPEDPVTLPCKHIFCKAEIKQWLAKHNTCPKCRLECFPETLPTAGRIDPVRMLQMSGTALTRSGLLNGTWTYYNDDISWTTTGLQRATEDADSWLEGQDAPRIAGPAVMNVRRLGQDIIAMGNLLRGHAAVTGRAYSRNQLRDWRMIAESLYRAVVTIDARTRARNERTVDALVLSRLLRSEVESSLRQANVAARSFLDSDNQEEEAPDGDYSILIAYIVIRATGEYARLEQRRQVIREEPRLLARVGMRLQDAFRG